MEIMVLAAVAAVAAVGSSSRTEQDRAAVAALDVAFQHAVKTNDAEAIDRLLHADFCLVLGDGAVVSRDEVVEEARARRIVYKVQDEDPGTQKVRVWGDTAVVTARLRIEGVREGQGFARTLWFSDTYVRTPAGWKYVFAQASSPLPVPGRDLPGDR